MTMHRIAAALTAFLLVASLPASAQDSAEIEWLMVVQGQVIAVDGEAMTLAAPPSAIVFTDRPVRRVGLVEIASFAETAWSAGGGFASDPPNASLIDEATGAIAIVTISDMSYEAGVLSLSVTLLSGELPTADAHVALTIDAIPTPVNGQITDSVTQSNVKVLGEAPAEAVGVLYQDVDPAEQNTDQNVQQQQMPETGVTPPGA